VAEQLVLHVEKEALLRMRINGPVQ